MAKERNNNLKILLCGWIVNRRFASANRPISRAKIGDFHLKYCIRKANAKNMISGSNVAPLPLVCLRNKQADPPRIHTGYSKEWRFLSERISTIAFFLIQTTFPEDPLWRLHSIVCGSFPENRRIFISSITPIGLMEWRKAGFEILLTSSHLKRRI